MARCVLLLLKENLPISFPNLIFSSYEEAFVYIVPTVRSNGV